MKTEDGFPEITTYLAERGVSFITDICAEGKGTAISNTYFLDTGDQYYMIDSACGKKRLQQIRSHLAGRKCDLLVTHSHLDHSANSGAAVPGNSRVIFHPLVAARINNLQSNYTEITPAMIKAFGVHGFFGRTGMLGPTMIKVLQFMQKYLPPVFYSLMQVISMMMLRSNIGAIHVPKKNALYLQYEACRDFNLGEVAFRGWALSENLLALDTPGHQNDHLAYYVPDKKIMFVGDLINFLNPNDILAGSIKDTHEGLAKMLQLAEAGGIEILAVSHTLPVIGQDNVIAYIRSVKEKQDEIFATVASIVSSCAVKNDFEEIITKIYAHESELMKKVLRINYPRSVSFIDVYVYLYMKEFVIPIFAKTDERFACDHVISK